MNTTNLSLEEILDEFGNNTYDQATNPDYHFGNLHKKAVKQIQALVNDCIPEKKDGAITNDDHAEGFVYGYDSAIEELTTKLKAKGLL